MKKPTKKEYQHLKEFKLRVQLEIHNALALNEQLYNDLTRTKGKVGHLMDWSEQKEKFLRLKIGPSNPYIVNIMGAEFKLWPDGGRYFEKEMKASVNKFTTTTW